MSERYSIAELASWDRPAYLSAATDRELQQVVRGAEKEAQLFTEFANDVKAELKKRKARKVI